MILYVYKRGIYHLNNILGGDTMATESFSKTFLVDRRSEQCMDKILKSKEPTIINQKKSFKRVSKEEILKMFSDGKNK